MNYSYDRRFATPRPKKESMVRDAIELYGREFKTAKGTARRAGKILLTMLPEGFKVAYPPENIYGIPTSHVGFEQDIEVDGHKIMSISGRMNHRAVRGDYVTPGRWILKEPTWEVQLWVPPTGGAYPAHTVKSERVPTVRDIKKVLAKITPEALLFALGGPKKGTRGGEVSIKDVKDFIKKQRTWMDLEDESPKHLFYSTREHGDMGDDAPGREDLREANTLAQAVIKEFGRDTVRVDVDYVDEWTHLEIGLHRK